MWDCIFAHPKSVYTDTARSSLRWASNPSHLALAPGLSQWSTTRKRTESKRLQRVTTSDLSLPGDVGTIWSKIEGNPEENYCDNTYGIIFKAKRRPPCDQPSNIPTIFSHYNVNFQKNFEEMELSDRIFLCQNPECCMYQVPQDRDKNASENLTELADEYLRSLR